ncbi:GntR family transcriptional regulator [Brachybacterium sp. UNK5269]|uniref:GntR family transcriptional regulator n=1 Tax=Brachybacterium sp. UNK5269 TaxID=3408576 RepID=UPI003BB11A4F
MSGSAVAIVEQKLQDLVVKEGLGPGDRLPPERDLASWLGVSRTTLRIAVESLQLEGLLARRPGRGGGTFVAGPTPVVELTDVRGISNQFRRLDMPLTSEVVGSGRVAAEHVPSVARSALRLAPEEGAFRLRRVRSTATDRVIYEDTWLRCDTVGGIEGADLTGSVYELLADLSGSRPAAKRELLQPGVASVEEARLLGVVPRRPVLRIERTALREDGCPVEYSRDVYRADLVQVQVATADWERVSGRLSDTAVVAAE